MGLFCCCFDNRREARCRFLFLLHLRSHHVLSEVLVQQDAVIDSSSAAASGSVPAAAETRTVGARLACQTSTVKRGLIPPFVAGAHAPWCFVFVISTSGPLIAVVRLIELGEVGLVDVGEVCVALFATRVQTTSRSTQVAASIRLRLVPGRLVPTLQPLNLRILAHVHVLLQAASVRHRKHDEH